MEAEMDCHLMPTSQPLTNATSSQGCFNLEAVDDTALNKRVEEQPAEEYKLGDLATIIQQTELSRSKHKNGLNLSISTDIRAFTIFGPTVFLYFQFMRRMIILLTLLSLLSIIPIVYNALQGEAYSRNAYGITAALAKTTIGAHIASGSHSVTGKILNISVVAFNICILMVFWIYWKKFTLEQSNQIEKDMGLANYGGIIIEMQQGHFEQNQLLLFVSRFGNVQEVQKVVDMKDVLYLAKKLHEAKERNRFLEYLLSQDIGRQEQLMVPIFQNRRQIDTLKMLLTEQLKQARASQQKTIRYFVKFDDHEAQRTILKTFNEYQGCCAKQVPQQLLNSKKIKAVRQQCQPEEIYWENQSVSWKQTLFPTILLILFINLFVVGGLILMALLLASTRPVYYQPLFSSKSLNHSAIAASANQTLLDSWCLSQKRNETGELCQATYDLYAIRVLISIALGVVLMVCRWLVKRVVFFFRPYLRFKDKVEQSKQVTMHLFINYSLISIVVALCVNTNLFSSAMVSIFISCLSQQSYMRDNLAALLQYPDYTSQWYLQYGYQLILNFIIMALLPHCITPIYQLIKRKVQLYKASKQKYQILMKQQLQLTAFEIEDHYASMLFVILVGFTFAGGLPILIPILLATLIIKYFTTKYLFLHFNKPPPITDRTLANKIPPILLFTITAYLLNSIWAFGVQSIFVSQSALFSDRGINADSNAHNPFQALLVFLKRLANTWQPAMIYIIGAITIIIRKLLLQVYSSYAHQNSNKKHHQASLQEEEERRKQARPLQANICEPINRSYKMQANKEYAPILRLLNTLNY